MDRHLVEVRSICCIREIRQGSLPAKDLLGLDVALSEAALRQLLITRPMTTTCSIWGDDWCTGGAMNVALRVNGKIEHLDIDPRTPLL